MSLERFEAELRRQLRERPYWTSAMAFGVGWFIGRTLPAGALIAVAGLGARTALLASVENAVLGQLRNQLVNEKETRDERR